MREQTDGLDVMDFRKLNEKEAIKKDNREDTLIKAVNKNHQNKLEQDRIEKELERSRIRKERNRRQKEKIKKNKQRKIMVSTAVFASAAAMTAATIVTSNRVSKGEEYIVNTINELNKTLDRKYSSDVIDKNNIESAKKDPNAPFLRYSSNGEVIYLNYEQASQEVAIIGQVIKDNGYPEEWIPIYINEITGTNLFNKQFKGSNTLSEVSTKLKAYDMMKEEKGKSR